MALLFLRLSLAWLLALHGSAGWRGLPAFWLTVACSIFALLLTIGLYIPFTAIAAAAIGTVAFFLPGKRCDPVTAGFVVVVMISLGLLGAGAYSLDARIYGRREVVVPTRHG